LDLGDGLFVFLSGLGLGFDVWDGYFGGPFFVFTEVFGLGLDLLGGLFLIGFFRFEIFPAPGIFAERGLVYRAGIPHYLSSLKMSATTFHWPSRICQFTTNLPTLDVGFPCASLTVVWKVPIS
jgi:hypothetical protein